MKQTFALGIIIVELLLLATSAHALSLRRDLPVGARRKSLPSVEGHFGCNVTTPSGVIDLSLIPTASLVVNQRFNGVSTPFLWQFSLCSPKAMPPSSNSIPCTFPGFVQEYTEDGKACQKSFASQNDGWRYNDTDGTVATQFSNYDGWLVNVVLRCGTAGPALSAVGPFPVQAHFPDGYEWNVVLETSVACPPAKTTLPPRPTTPTNTPSPIPAATYPQTTTASPVPSGSGAPHHCSVSTPWAGVINLAEIPSGKFVIDQIFNGLKTPYLWTMNLCNPLAPVPHNASSCATPGYIGEYSADGERCEESWSVMSMPWAINSSAVPSVSAQFTSVKGWEMNVDVKCGSSSLAPEGTVTARKGPAGTGTFIFDLSLTSLFVCPGTTTTNTPPSGMPTTSVMPTPTSTYPVPTPTSTKAASRP